MDIYILLHNDRHIDTYAKVYSNREKAIEAAKAIRQEILDRGLYKPEELDENLNSAMQRSGWIYWSSLSCEGDFVYVQKSTLDPQP